MLNGYVYLIGETNNSGKYKIGSTRKININERIKELQTGNPNELYLKDSFKTNKPFRLETMLHKHYQNLNENGEWFDLNEEEVTNFKNVCEKYQHIIDSLKDNPFFK